jgi:N-acetylmuramoyl-L-alanine amidase
MAAPFARFDRFPHAPLASWRPQLPKGRLERIYLHWSAGDYETVYTAYHYCIAFAQGVPLVVETYDLRANMREIHAGDSAYAAHTAGRNSYAAGLAVMAMRDATPENFAGYPLVEPAIDAMCRVAAAIARGYAIPIDRDHVMTHAEAALADGYFGTGGDEERWDIARLQPSPTPLTPQDARMTGDVLRARCRA